MDIHYRPIGVIHTPFQSLERMPIQPAGAKGKPGRVEVYPEFAAGLADLDGFSHIILLYHLHQVQEYRLSVIPFLDSEPRGLFATRAPARPNPIGLSIVKLARVEGNNLYVEEVDILDGTPLLDIKPYVAEFDRPAASRSGWLERSKGQVKMKRSDDRFIKGFDAAALAGEIAGRIRSLPKRDTASVRAVRREYSQRLKHAPAEQVLALSQALMDLPGGDFRFVAYELVKYHPAARSSLGEAELLRFGQGLDSWDAVDTFACYLAGPAWRAGQVPDELIHGWAASEDRWWRRAALVSTVPLNTRAQGGTGDIPRTLAVCEQLLHDRDDMVVKALSWALRELIPWDARAVEAFITEHQAELAPRVRREVRNKLQTGLKNPRQR